MDIRTYLSQGKPLLFDGAMGTYFASLSGRSSQRCELANLEAPEEIRSIHRAYLEAGCKAITTNTFSVGTDLADGNDVLAGRIPGVLRKEVYATASLLGSIFLYGAVIPFEVPLEVGAIVSFSVTVAIRLVAIRLHLNIPRIRRVRHRHL